jgi:hypothetical protein
MHGGIADLRYVAVVDPDRGRSTGLPAEAYDAARALARKLGHLDLAHGFGRLCRSTAAESDDPLAVEVGETTRAHDLLAAADFDLAAVVTDRAVDRLTELPVADGQPSVAGYMHLGAALVAARRGDDRTWQEPHAEAEEAAHRLGDDHRIGFGRRAGARHGSDPAPGHRTRRGARPGRPGRPGGTLRDVTTPDRPPPQRVRVVLADGRARRTPVRTLASQELEEQTGVGDALVRGLVRAQLGLALRLSVIVGIGLGLLPLLFALAPGLAGVKLLGIALPWLLLGLLAYPFLLVVGWVHVRVAERNERDFAELVERS